ncbi:hypothetical protein ABZ551_38195, partial [Streptomyces rimosus]
MPAPDPAHAPDSADAPFPSRPQLPATRRYDNPLPRTGTRTPAPPHPRVARLALGAEPADVVIAVTANFAAWGGYCATV